ncbi:shikimate kinase [soil metagenome]
MTDYSGGLLFLVGPSGVGKTTVGRALARRLAVDFFDSDHEIEARCGCAISLIFEVEGESGFRVRETQVLRELCLRSSGICSTGGGIVLAEQNRQLMRAHGTVVYLHAPPAVLHARTRGDKTRPLLQTVDPRAAIEAMYAKRDALYRDVADLVVEASTPGAALAADEIVRRLRPAEP